MIVAEMTNWDENKKEGNARKRAKNTITGNTKNKKEKEMEDADQAIKRRTNKNKVSRIGTWNVRGIKEKEEELVEEMEKQNIEILGITETKKKGTGMRTLHKGYWMIWSGIEDPGKAKGGVGLIVAPNRKKEIINEKCTNERLLKVEMKQEEGEIWTIIVAYGVNDDAQKEDKDKFFEHLQKEIDEGKETVIIMGDLNGRVGNNNEGMEEIMGKEGEEKKNNNGDRILDLCKENNLVITNTKFKHKDIHKYTREEPSRSEKSIIDYFLISRNKWRRVTNVKVSRNAEIGSDHFLLRMDLREMKIEKKDKRRMRTKEKIKSYKLTELSFQKKYQELLKIKWSRTEKKIGIEEKWDRFKKILLEAAKESCGITRISNNVRKKTDWWTENLKRTIKKKKEAWKRYLNTKREEDYEEYKEKRKEAKMEVNRAKQESWEKFGEKMTRNYRENQKLFYGTLKQLKKTKEYSMLNIKDKQGQIITDEDEIMERWRQYFEELTLTDTEEMELTEDKQDTAEVITFKEKEVMEALRKIKTGKAPGNDNITPEMIKYMDEEGLKQLTEILNDIGRDIQIPGDWKIGTVIPLHKKGDKRDCNNYRGITLNSVPGKVLARIIEKRIRDKLEETFEDTQGGFRRGRSTHDLTFMLRQISEKIISKDREVHVCFIDLEKAFDRIRRTDIWKGLEKKGIDVRTIKIIKELYKGNKNIVKMNNEESKEYESKIGVKQGCVMSPLLFTIVLDECIKEVKKNMRTLKLGYWKMQLIQISEMLFADDMVIVAGSEKDLQHNIEILDQALKNINMKINTEKTKTMIISRNRKEHVIRLNGKQLEQVESYKYLGSFIESNGKIDKEIRERLGKTGKIFNMMKTTFFGRKVIPKEIRTDMVKKIVRPTLIYGSETWTITEKQKSKINATDMRFLRKIEGKTRLDKITNETHRRNLKIEPINDKIMEGQMRWLGHVYRMDEERNTRRIYETKTIGSNYQGRPRKTWEDGVKEELEEKGIRWQEVRKLTQDRKGWRKLYTEMYNSAKIK